MSDSTATPAVPVDGAAVAETLELLQEFLAEVGPDATIPAQRFLAMLASRHQEAVAELTRWHATDCHELRANAIGKQQGLAQVVRDLLAFDLTGA